MYQLHNDLLIQILYIFIQVAWNNVLSAVDVKIQNLVLNPIKTRVKYQFLYLMGI